MCQVQQPSSSVQSSERMKLLMNQVDCYVYSLAEFCFPCDQLSDHVTICSLYVHDMLLL